MNRPLYFQLPSANPEMLTHFYATVFGWQKLKLPQFEDIWAMITGRPGQPGLDGIVMGKFMDCTVNIISVDNLELILQNVQKHGGKITTPITHVEDMSDSAWCVDSDDNPFVVMQASPETAATLRKGVDTSVFGSMMSRPVHFEIPATNPMELADFYTNVFGWTSQVWDGPFPYIFLMTGTEPIEGIDGAITLKSDTRYPVNTINTDDIDKCLEAVVQAGGSILMPKEQIPGVGLFAYALDPDNNQFGIMQFVKP